MSVAKWFERLAGAAARRPVLTIGIVLALAIGGGLLALGLKPSAGTDTFVSKSSASYKATADDQRHFGDDAVIVLIHEPLTDLVRDQGPGDGDAARGLLRRPVRGRQPEAARVHARRARHARAYGGTSSPCGKLARVQAGPGGVRARDVPQPRRRGGQHADPGDAGGRQHVGHRRRAQRLQARDRARAGPRAGAQGRQRRRPARVPAAAAVTRAARASSRGSRRCRRSTRRSSSRRSCSTRPAASISPRRASPTCSRPPTTR